MSSPYSQHAYYFEKIGIIIRSFEPNLRFDGWVDHHEAKSPMRVAFYLIDLLSRYLLRCPFSHKLMPLLRLFAMSSAGQTNHDHHFRNYKRQEIEQREDDDAREFVPVLTPSHLPLPQHWQSFRDKSGRVFYVDHETRRKFRISILLGYKYLGT